VHRVVPCALLRARLVYRVRSLNKYKVLGAQSAALPVAALACALLVIPSFSGAASLPEGPRPGVSVEAKRRPSSQQLNRLDRLEPLIRYFSSLSYGPDDARVNGDYIRALILTESGANIRARSRKGARGLTQIMPSTARWAVAHLARENYDYLYVDEDVFKDFVADDLYHPGLNVLLACYLNATYNQRFDGQVELMAAAWNAGPGAVRRYGNQPPPYPETLTLIRRVLGYIDFFTATVGVNPASPGLALK